MEETPTTVPTQEPATGATLSRCGVDVSSAATVEDIARAVDEEPRDEDWYLILGLPGDDVMETSIEEDGTFSLEAEVGADSLLRTVSVVDAELLKQILASFLQGDGNWRSMARWESPPPAPAKRPFDAARLLPWGLAAAGALMAVLVFLGRAKWMWALVLLAIPIGISAAILAKLREVRRASAWTKASARIVRSESVSRQHHGKTAAAPVVEYEFSVGFDKFRGNRISVGEILPGTPQVEEALKRYRAGASVPVFYDPKDPRQSVLERELPAKFGAIWAFVAVVAAACIAGAVLLVR